MRAFGDLARFTVMGPMPGLNELFKAVAKEARQEGSSRDWYNVIKKNWELQVGNAAILAGLREGDFPCGYRIGLTCYEKGMKARRRDRANVLAGAEKLVLDGLVEAHIIPDDGPGYDRGYYSLPAVVYGALLPRVEVAICGCSAVSA